MKALLLLLMVLPLTSFAQVMLELDSRPTRSELDSMLSASTRFVWLGGWLRDDPSEAVSLLDSRTDIRTDVFFVADQDGAKCVAEWVPIGMVREYEASMQYAGYRLSCAHTWVRPDMGEVTFVPIEDLHNIADPEIVFGDASVIYFYRLNPTPDVKDVQGQKIPMAFR